MIARPTPSSVTSLRQMLRLQRFVLMIVEGGYLLPMTPSKCGSLTFPTVCLFSFILDFLCFFVFLICVFNLCFFNFFNLCFFKMRREISARSAKLCLRVNSKREGDQKLAVALLARRRVQRERTPLCHGRDLGKAPCIVKTGSSLRPCRHAVALTHG